MKNQIKNYSTDVALKTMEQMISKNGKWVCIAYGIWAAHDLIDKAIKAGVPAHLKYDKKGSVEFSVNDNTFVVE